MLGNKSKIDGKYIKSSGKHRQKLVTPLAPTAQHNLHFVGKK
jgi:hypothetical protein